MARSAELFAAEQEAIHPYAVGFPPPAEQFGWNVDRRPAAVGPIHDGQDQESWCHGCGNPWTCSFRRMRLGSRGGGTGKNGNAAFVT